MFSWRPTDTILGVRNQAAPIKGWKGFIQLSHVSADAGLSFYQVDMLSCICQPQGCLDSAIPAPPPQQIASYQPGRASMDD